MDRIPFSSRDQTTIRSLANWMLVAAVPQGLGGLALFLVSALAIVGAVSVPTSTFVTLVNVALGLAMLAGGVALLAEIALLFMARSSLFETVEGGGDQRGAVARAMSRLKYFFLLEMGFFAVSLLATLLSIVLHFATGGQSTSVGEDVVEMIRNARGQR